MEKEQSENLTIDLEASSDKVDDNASDVGNEQEHANEKTDETVDKPKPSEEGSVSDFSNGNADEKKASAKQPLVDEKNPDQNKLKPDIKSVVDRLSSLATTQRRPSAEEIAKNWQDLGVQRCPNCKFSTDNKELFKNHCTTCPAVRSTGRITLTYSDGKFKCNVCDETWINKAEFEEHIVCHIQDSPYVCLTCQNKKFLSRQLIEIHTKHEHPNGDARCGLKGMKNGRKYSEELINCGTISIQGKLSIPKTPRNAINLVKVKGSDQNKIGESKSTGVISTPTNNEVDSAQKNSTTPAVVTGQQSTFAPRSPPGTSQVASNTVHYRPVVLNVRNLTQTMLSPSGVVSSVPIGNTIITPPTTVVASSVSLQVSSASQIVNAIANQIQFSKTQESDMDSSSSRPMPPARTCVNLLPGVSSSHLYTSKGGTFIRISAGEEAKSKHLNSLFGELNRTTNVVQPTVVSQKIKEIANPPSLDKNRMKIDASSQHIPYNVKTITEYTCTQSTVSISPAVSTMPPQNLILVPVGQPIMQPPGPIMTSSGIIYQGPNNSSLFVPIQPNSVTGASINVQPAPAVTSIPPKLQIMGQVSTNSVIYEPGTMIKAQQTNLVSGYSRVQPVASTSRTMPPLRQAPSAQSEPPTYKEAIIERHTSNVSQVPTDTTTQASLKDEIQRIPKKYLFKIKPGQGFVCEACRKFTREECVFRRHVWEHFHGTPLACKTCSPERTLQRKFLECKLVGNIVCNLIKQSITPPDTQQKSAKKLNILKVGDNEVIDITDDEDDKSENQKQEIQGPATEVIVLDDDDENGDGSGLQIRISNTFSLSSSNSLEQMRKKDTSNKEGEKTLDEPTSKENDVQDEGFTNESANTEAREIGIREIDDNKTNQLLDNSQSKPDLPRSSAIDESEKNNMNRSDKAKDSLYHFEQSVCNEEKEEDDDDGKIKGKDLLDKSLSEPDNDSEEIVSQVLDTNLRDYDPTWRSPKEAFYEGANFEESTIQSNLTKVSYDESYMKNQENEGHSNPVDVNLDQVNNRSKTVFESDVLSKQSTNAFYVCGYEHCLFVGMSSSKYREHIQSPQHANEYNYVCGHCGQKDYTEDTHVRHLFSHANSKTFLLYKCPIRHCRYKTNLLNMYADHLRAHPKEELTVKCTYCHKAFPSIDSLAQHLKQNLLKFVICPYCSFKFVNKYVVTNHIRLFHPDKIRMVSVTSQVVCNEREINFYEAPKSKTPQSDLTAKETEVIDIPTLLDNFQKGNNSKENSAQQQNVLGKGSEYGDTDDVLSLPEEDQGDFKDKEKHMKEKQSKQTEIESKRPTKPKQKSDIIFKGGPKSLECPQCSYLSYNQSLHAKHLLIHDSEPERAKQFVCTLCPKGSENLVKFKTHVKNHVGKHVIKLYCCTGCTYCSNQKSHIMDHIEDAHAKKTLYTLKEETVESEHSQCSFCTFKARHIDQVTVHETAVHIQNVSAEIRAEKEKDHQKDKNTSPKNVVPTESTPGLVSDDVENVARKKKYKYHCEYCSEFFKHKSYLKEHLKTKHKDIENKQFIFFKCKYCVYTSTMKDMIIAHLEKEHLGLDLRILRKVENVENDQPKTVEESQNAELAKNEDKSSTENQPKDHINDEKDSDIDIEKIEIVIPDGNVFKQMFSCPVCSFSSNVRIKTMKHLKQHPEVKPIRPDQQKQSPSKSTARKSSSSLFPKVNLSKKKSILMQPMPKSAKPIQNPFTAVKDSVSSESESKVMFNSPSKDPYILGEQKLHEALSACFILFEKDMKFQCRICKQKIFKKFVLHRHILDHLKIVFFKCKYCDEGSIERTLMVGHIQKEHSPQNIIYESVEKSVLEQQLKERIFNQDFNDTLDIGSSTGSQGSATDMLKNTGIVKKAVHEYQTIEDDSSEENDGFEEPVKDSEDAKTNSLKCPQCRYVARFKHFLNLHLDSHKDPLKVFTCSVCDYRGDRFSVIKHVYSVFHLTQAKVLENGKPLYEKLNSQKTKEDIKSDKGKNESKTIPEAVKQNKEKASDENKSMTDIQEQENKPESSVDDKSQSSTVSKASVYEMRTLYKCKECGLKRESKSGIYRHFKTSKCNKPVVKCSLCSFQSNVKAMIYRHAEKRHPGKKISIMDLPISNKFKIMKIPVRQSQNISNDETMKDTDDKDSNDESSPDSPNGVTLDVEEGESSKESQIRCQLCTNYLCESAMKLQFHINTVHQSATLFCQKCSYKSPLVKHMINHCKNLHLQKVALYGKQPKSSITKSETDTNVKQEKMSRTINADNEDKVVIKCPKCDIEFSSLHCIPNHLYIHFNYKPYCCKYCGKCSARLHHMKKHIEHIHDGKPIKYELKTDESIEAKVRKMHESVKRSVMKQRMMLGKMRPSKLDKMELVEDGIRRKEKMHYCDYCQYHTERRSVVRNHVSNMHAGISVKRPLEVDSDTESPIKKVVKKEDSSDIVSGSETDEVDKTDEELPLLKYKVIKTQNGTKKFKCSGCDYMNEKIKNLKVHMWRNHGSASSPKKEKGYKCFYCSYSSTHKSSNIYQHLKVHHPSMTVKFLNKLGEVVTRDQTGHQAKVLKSEVVSPGRSSSSPIVSPGRSSSSPIVSPGRSSSPSPARSTTDSIKTDLSQMKPVQQKKTGITKYNCSFCDYSGIGYFHFRLHLIAHEEFTKVTSELDDESVKSCGFCSYLGKTTFDLCVHIASHMADMRYKCAYCDYSQFTMSKVSQHLRYIHPDREDIVIDRELKKASNGKLKLVNFNPVLKIKALKKKRKFKRIMIETDESSHGSSSDTEEDNVNAAKSRPSLKSKRIKYIDGSETESGVEQSNKGNESKEINQEVKTNCGGKEEVLSEKAREKAEKESVEDSVREDVVLTLCINKLDEESAKETVNNKSESIKNSMNDKIETAEGNEAKEKQSSESEQRQRSKESKSDCPGNGNSILADKNLIEDSESNESQLFRMETQPFSPSDINFTEDDSINENELGMNQNFMKEEESGKSSLRINQTRSLDGDLKKEIGRSEETELHRNVTGVSTDKELNQLHSDLKENDKEDIISGENTEHSDKMTLNEASTSSLNTADQINDAIVQENGTANQSNDIVEQENITAYQSKDTSVQKNIDNEQELGCKEDRHIDLQGKETIDNEDESVCMQRQNIENKTVKDGNSDNMDTGDGASECIVKCLNNETQEDNENTCSSSSAFNETDEGQMDLNKSPRNVFESVSCDIKSACEEAKQIESDGTKEQTSPHDGSEGIGNTSNARENVNMFEKFSMEIDQSESDLKNKSVCEESNCQESDLTDKSSISIDENEEVESTLKSKENVNVFEKFSSEIKHGEASNVCDKDEKSGNESEESPDNIFEKFCNDSATKSDNEENAKELDVPEEEITEKNIFETFGKVSNEHMNECTFKDSSVKFTNEDCNEDKYSQNVETQETKLKSKLDDEVMDEENNVFTKFSTECLYTPDHDMKDHIEDKKNSGKNDDDIDTNADTENEQAVIKDREEEKDNDKNLFEQFAHTEAIAGASASDNGKIAKQTKCLEGTSNSENENMIEDMEFDELINSIEETVNESKIKEPNIQKMEIE